MIKLYDHQYNGFAIGELPVNGSLPVEACRQDYGKAPILKDLSRGIGGFALPPQAKEDFERVRQMQAELDELGGPIIEAEF